MIVGLISSLGRYHRRLSLHLGLGANVTMDPVVAVQNLSDAASSSFPHLGGDAAAATVNYNCAEGRFDFGDISMMMMATTFVMLQTPAMGIAQVHYAPLHIVSACDDNNFSKFV